jgi:AraC-like DNA-binding protein
MKISEVPQDDIRTLNGLKKALYAVDEQGCYAKTTTRGWETEEVVLNQVIGDFDEKAREAASRVKSSETSPIEYFMYKHWMDLQTLAQAMGLYRWQVKRHFKPSIFRKLDDRRLAEYAALFRISVYALKNYPGED